MKGILMGVILANFLSLSITYTVCGERLALLTWALFLLLLALSNSEEEIFE